MKFYILKILKKNSIFKNTKLKEPTENDKIIWCFRVSHYKGAGIKNFLELVNSRIHEKNRP